ncbi:hypothetical protein LCGC14_2893960 [marine sediment metagenome]|uniref:Uncharacterized protein n=1 Tax=marine sediment metagenome TaxID=412755 RepID=A0A0F9A4B5_9ZZZZ
MPRFGELMAVDVWAAATRVLTAGTNLNNIAAADVWAVATRDLTDISIEEVFDLPIVDDTYGAIDVNSAASVDGFGSSLQVSADVGTGKRLLFLLLSQDAASAISKVQIEFRDTSAGSGNLVAIVNAGWVISSTGYVVPIYRSLTDNSALHVRVKDSNGGALGYRLGVAIA